MDGTLNEPKLMEGPVLHIAGLEGHYTREQTLEIPAQWERFNAALTPSGLRPPDDVTYGVIYASTPMRYITGVNVSPEAALPEGWIATDVPRQQYAVFAESGGVEGIRRVWPMIFSDWLPHSGYKQVAGPMLERYDHRWMEPGEFEIWVPVEPKI